MEPSIEEKQQYLVTEIIDKGFDPEEFQEYLISTSGKEVDLHNWQLSQLEKIVKQFQAIKSDPQPHQSIIQDEQEPMKPSRDQESEQTNGYLQFNFKSKQETYSHIFNCIQIPPNELLNKDVEVRVLNFIKKQGGIFEQSYYSYVVHTPCLGKTVERRYSDFEWLKRALQLHHPGLPVPPIPKKGQYRRSDDKHLNKRRMILEMFLNKLVQIPELKADQILENFLKFQDLVIFEKFKSECKRSSYVELSKVKNTRGKINVAIEPKINSFLIKSQRYIFETQPMIKKVYKEFKHAASSLEGCSEVLKGISKLCADMDKRDQNFRETVEIPYNSSNTFSMLRDSCNNFADLINKQAQSFRTDVYACIKYESLNSLNLLESFDQLKTFQVEYLEAKNALFRRKERLYDEGQMNRWGLTTVPSSKPEKTEAIKMMLPKQNELLNKIRVSYGLRNFHLYEEINRHFLRNNRYMGKHMMNYTKVQSGLTGELMMVWVDAQTQALGMEEGKSIQNVLIQA